MFLNASADKLKREQETRARELRRREEKERAAKLRADALAREGSDGAARGRLEARQLAAEAKARDERVLANNEGVTWTRVLVGARSDDATRRGIRARTDDKVRPISRWSRPHDRVGAVNADP